MRWFEEQRGGPKGTHDLYFGAWGIVESKRLIQVEIWATRQKGIWGVRLALDNEAVIWASRLSFEPQGWDFGL